MPAGLSDLQYQQQVPFVFLPNSLRFETPAETRHRNAINGSRPSESTMYCISLPANPLTIAYAGWYSSQTEGNTDYGIWMEPSSTWEASYGRDTMETLLRSLSERGYPTAVWMLVLEDDNGTSAWFMEKRE
jgi:hypothetical protein